MALPPEKMSPVPASAAVKRWFDKGDGDLRTAKALLAMDDIPTSAIGFHAQQAAEKYLKGILVAKGIEPPYEHGLRRLRNLLQSVSLPPHVPASHFAVLERYPKRDDLTSEEPPRSDVELAIQYAERLRHATLRQLRQLAGADKPAISRG
jgi:HEPN domain-containing protein